MYLEKSPRFCLLIKTCKFHLVELLGHFSIIIPSFKLMIDVPAKVSIPLTVRLVNNLKEKKISYCKINNSLDAELITHLRVL